VNGRQWTHGDVTYATPDTLPLTKTCHATLDSAALFQLPSLWYRFQGTGLNMTLFRATWPDPHAVMILYEGACPSPPSASSPSTTPSSTLSLLKCVSSHQISTFRVWDAHGAADTHINGLTISSTNANVTYYVWMCVWPRPDRYTSTIRLVLSDENANAVPPLPNM
jgi:hypothetical protein